MASPDAVELTEAKKTATLGDDTEGGDGIPPVPAEAELKQMDMEDILAAMNGSQMKERNYQVLNAFGNAPELIKRLDIDVENGLSSEQVERHREQYGTNAMESAPMKWFLVLFLEAFDDQVLWVLMAAAAVSLILSFVPHYEPLGYIEGLAIFVAVFIVAIVTALNDYSKELQFRALEKLNEKDNRCMVKREGKYRPIKPDDIVVGDIMLLKGGDQIFADAVLYKLNEESGVDTDEAALTGESEAQKKSCIPRSGAETADPFVLSGTVCLSHGNCEGAEALVIGVGGGSQWGKIKAELDNTPPDTPLQEKLNDMVAIIGIGGSVAAALTFIISVIYAIVRDDKSELVNGILEAFIIAITIIVVAIPEGLPMAVTISLAYSTHKMFEENNFIKVLAACETMGNATNICSDKTGTLTIGVMNLVEGWFADSYYSEEDFKATVVPDWKKSMPSWLSAQVLENITFNTDGQVVYGIELQPPLESGGLRDPEPIHLPWEFDEEKKKEIVDETWTIPKEELDKRADDKAKAGPCSSVKSLPPRYRQEEFVRAEHKSMTDLALLKFAHSLKYDTVQKKKEIKILKVIPFNSKVKRSAAVVQLENGTVRLLVKGAPEIVLEMCSKFTNGEGAKMNLNEAKRVEIAKAQLEMARGSKRVLGLAHRDIDASEASPEDLMKMSSLEIDELVAKPQLVIDAYVGIIDPLRDDVADAVKIAQDAGVTVRMVTGDNLETARAIATKAGIYREGEHIAMEGPKFRTMTPAEVDAIIPKLTVLARSAPQDKLMLVQRLNGAKLPKNEEEWLEKHPGKSWEKDRDLLLPGYKEEWDKVYKEGGEVVGVTGDGTNDAPALTTADVGLAMGITGTGVAKSAADIVILDDKFSSIVTAIKWGRCVYDNIRKFLQFQLTVNVVALMIVFLGALMGTEPPLTAVQMLWVNLIMDTMGALALGTEKPTNEVLKRPPYKRSASLVSIPMWRNIFAQSILQLIVLMLLLTTGYKWFGKPYIYDGSHGPACNEFQKKSDGPKWLWNIDGSVNKESGEIGCNTFLKGLTRSGNAVSESKYDCEDDNEPDPDNRGSATICYEDNYGSGSGSDWKGHFDKINHKSFKDICLECIDYDFEHFGLIFNAFVFLQVFNEFNARSIKHDWNVFQGLHKNWIFSAVILVTILTQILLMSLGSFSPEGAMALSTAPLTAEQWVATVGLGMLALPVGFLMRFIPGFEEDPGAFAGGPKEKNLLQAFGIECFGFNKYDAEDDTEDRTVAKEDV